MTYLVEFAACAVRDLEILYREKNAAESHAAARWYSELELAVYALASYPPSLPRSPGGSEDEARVTEPALWQEASRLSGHL